MSIGNIGGPGGPNFGGGGSNNKLQTLAGQIINGRATDEIKSQVKELSETEKFGLGNLLSAQLRKIQELMESGQHPNIALIMSMIAPFHKRIKSIVDELED